MKTSRNKQGGQKLKTVDYCRQYGTGSFGTKIWVPSSTAVVLVAGSTVKYINKGIFSLISGNLNN